MSEMAVITGTDVGPGVPAPRGANRSLTARVLRNPLGAICVAYLVLIIVAGFLAGPISGYDPNRSSPREIRLLPSAAHWLGTDSSGRDLFARLLYGTLPTLRDAALAVIVAATIGLLFGLLAGYYGKWLETLGTWLADLLIALPGLVVLLAVRAVIGPSMTILMMVLGVVMAGGFFRVVYAAVLGVRNELFVDAAKVFQLSGPRIMVRHILPTVRGPAVILIANLMAVSIAIQAGLVFLGLGDLFAPIWGNLLNAGFANIYKRPLEIVWPSTAIGLTCIVFFLLGNVVRDAMARVDSAASGAVAEAAATEASENGVPNAADCGSASGGGGPVDTRPVIHASSPPTTATDDEIVLNITDLAIGYPRLGGGVNRVVDGIDLRVRRGEVHGLIGESGSGKSQTVLAVMRLLPEGGRIITGDVTLDGQDMTTLTERRLSQLRGRLFGYVPQEPMSNLDPVFTVGSQLIEPMRAHLGLSRTAARTRALELLDQVGIEHPERVLRSYPHQVSGGMAQRILIAGAISCRPTLLVADEPTTALDVTIQAEILELLRDLRQQLGLTVLLVTHNLGVVADICDDVSVMQSGKIVETGTVADVFAKPQHHYTQALFDATLDNAPPREPYSPPRGTGARHD